MLGSYMEAAVSPRDNVTSRVNSAKASRVWPNANLVHLDLLRESLKNWRDYTNRAGQIKRPDIWLDKGPDQYKMAMHFSDEGHHVLILQKPAEANADASHFYAPDMVNILSRIMPLERAYRHGDTPDYFQWGGKGSRLRYGDVESIVVPDNAICPWGSSEAIQAAMRRFQRMYDALSHSEKALFSTPGGMRTVAATLLQTAMYYPHMMECCVCVLNFLNAALGDDIVQLRTGFTCLVQNLWTQLRDEGAAMEKRHAIDMKQKGITFRSIPEMLQNQQRCENVGRLLCDMVYYELFAITGVACSDTCVILALLELATT